MKDTVQWTTPSPLWENAISQNSAVLRREELSRPSILRFATDTFMDDFLQMLESDPKRFGQFIALSETWRGISPLPEIIKPAPAFARKFQRLGIINTRKKAKINALSQIDNQLRRFDNASVSDKPLKLYQPAHQRFYLISACLVCERPGLPDKALNNGREEKVSFVIRRLFPPGELDINENLPDLNSTWEEYAFVMTDQGGKWKRIENQKRESLVENEEQLPLFSVNFNEDDGRRRKLFAGVIPAGKREAYISAGKASTENNIGSAETDSIPDSRIFLMRSIFRDPWKSLLQNVSHTKAALGEQFDDNAQPYAVKKDLLNGSREQMQAISWLTLLDFADFLKSNTPKVWQSLNGETVTLNTNEIALKNAIINTSLNASFTADLNSVQSTFLKDTNYSKTSVLRSLKDALIKITKINPKTGNKYADDLETVGISYDRKTPNNQFPNFLFPLADPFFNLQTNLGSGNLQITPTDFKTNDFDGENLVNRIAQLVEAALPPMPEDQPLQATPLAAQTPMDMREGWFVIRCVYERPLCGTIDPPILSEPTKPFQIAGFFDADAPARPIRIALPIDTTPAGLRKFNKNTAFMMSDLLCGQVNRMKGITFGDLIRSVLPFPLHKDLSVPDAGGCKDGGGLSIGMMCSLSIPIITICALILLMIIVSLLDFIFRWLPYFIICFPLPGLKGKK